MAAYAALVSVMNIIETIQNHPRPPISFDKDQLQSLIENITFLQELLETHSIDDEGLESRIADAAYAAEDVIESHIVDQIEASETISCADFYNGLHKVIQDFDLIRRDSTSFARKTGTKDGDDDQLLQNNYSFRRPHPSTGQETTVGLDDVVVEIMDKLTWNQSKSQIFPIVGMGGIGKTTLARNVYDNQVIVDHFVLRGWATISQEYNSKQILLEVLICFEREVSRESLNEMSEDKLGEKLYKLLCGRRYLIVFDDIWSMEAWDRVKTFFPQNNVGSAIILTTRLSNLALRLSDSCFEMSFLGEEKSWKLFCKTTFGEESCPRELEGIGKKIVENCKGLPLSIVVVGGLLSKSKRTQEYWLYIAVNLNLILNLQDNEHCLNILQLSYKELPAHLKPCFLYMGVYPEDCEIDVAELTRLWIAEGFLKPVRGKCLEVVAKEYFNDLLARNLILVHERGCKGETIKCKVHDLLVDVCVREAQKYKFFCVARYHNFSNPRDLNTLRRIVVHDGTKSEVIHAFLSHGTLVRSITCKYSNSFSNLFNFRLLRVWNGFDVAIGAPFPMMHFLENAHGIVNCRYICGVSIHSPNLTLPSSIFSLWNLQTLDVHSRKVVVATSEIWKMSQLRHVQFYKLNLPNPPLSGHTNDDHVDDFVLGNLQTLSHVINFKFSEGVVKRIPNLKELSVFYERIEDWSSCCLYNLVQLINLESLDFRTGFLGRPIPSELLENLTFPQSLKELTLGGIKLDCGDLGTKIGSLPHLQVLKLYAGAFVGAEWETDEGQYCSLKYLEIYRLHDLVHWRTGSWTHFPSLEHLFLMELTKLEAIPLEIGETLKSIEIVDCRDSVIFSAKEILNEQEDLGNEGPQVKIKIWGKNRDVESLAASKFQVEVIT